MSTNVANPPKQGGLTPAEAARTAEIETRLKHLIVEALKLDDVQPDEIDSDAALVGSGLELDSIDILELAMAIHREFGVKTEQDESRNEKIFGSVKSLAEFIVVQSES